MDRGRGTPWAVRAVLRVGVVGLVAAYALLVPPAAAQPPTAPAPGTPTPGAPTKPGTPTAPGAPTAPTESTTGVPEGPTPSGILPNVQIPGVLLPPRGPFDFLLYPAPAQGPLTVTPSFAITEQFNDNVFLTHSNKQSDFITQFTPGVTLQAQQPGLQLFSNFNFTAEIYAKNSELDNAANRLAFLTSVFYQATQRVSLTLTESLGYNRNSNLVAVSGVSSGRESSWVNVIAPAVSVQLTPRTTWRVYGSYTLERFGSGETNSSSQNSSSQSSNLYHVGTGFGYTLTPRLTLTADYDFGYLDVEHEPTAYVHTLRFGGSYQVLPSLTVTASAGPSITLTDHDTEVTPSVAARITKQMSWGFMSAFYEQGIGTNGAFGGISNNQTFGGNITVTTLMRGLYLDLSPRYSITRTTGASQSNADINALNVVLSARYQIARYIGLIASYNLLHQTGSANGTSRNSNDVDQNSVTFGVQFGYPINFY